MHALAKLCIERPVFATMLIMTLVVIGAFSYNTLGVDLFPKVDIPSVQVVVADPGASPEEIETEITKKIEEAVNTISEIDELRSISSEGRAFVQVTFLLSKNGDIAAQEVQNKVNQIINDLPATAKRPEVLKFDPDAAPVLQIGLSAQRSLRDVTMIADKLLKQKLESSPGVGQIRIVGGAKREIHVLADPEKLRAYNLTINDLFNAIRSQNLELPGGDLRQGQLDFTVRTEGRVVKPEQFNQIAVANRNGYVVKVSDVGYAEDSYEEPETTARLDGQAAVTLIVSKQSGENTVATADGVKQRLKEIEATLPKDVKASIIADQSVFIVAAVDNIKHHLVLGSLFASIVIFLFLANWRTTLIASIAIPTSIISSFALMAAMGLTLNQITMLALTLMVGIVIDDAIIVLENIYRFMEEKGMSPVEAAIHGTGEIGLAVMATTLSLLAVFLPVGFMGGIVGRFMSSFGFTSAFAIAVSLLVSFTLTPMLTSRFVKPPSKHGKDAHSSKDSPVFKVIDRSYTSMLHWAMAHRGIMLGLSVLVIMSIVPLFMFVGKNFLPGDDQSQFNVLVRTPEGTSLAASTAMTEQIARDIRNLPGVIHTLSTVGGGQDHSANNSAIFVKLSDIEQRQVSQTDVMQLTRKLLKSYPKEIHAGVELVSAVGGGNSNAEIQFYIQGPDLERLGQYSAALMAKLSALPGVADTDTTLRTGKPEFRLVIDRDRAADLGVSVLDIEQALNTLVAGQVASTFNAGDEQYDVRVRAQEKFRTTQEQLAALTIPSQKRGTVSLDEVVRIRPGSGPSSVNRINRQRQVTISANTLPGGSQAAILQGITAAADELHMDSDYRYGTAGTSKELGRTGYYFGLAFSLTFIFMYIVLAAQFESFIHPITILMTLPLAIPFGILSLLVTGQTVNIFSGLGLLLLFGIVKKNAILQIDHMNGLRKTGMSQYDAIIQANRDRLRPILMTTIALVAGMAPLVLSNGVGSATNRSIGVLVVGGQSLCLLLTLLAVPVFYSYFEDLGNSTFLSRMFAKISGIFARNKTNPIPDVTVVLLAVGLALSMCAKPVQAADTTVRIGILGSAKITLNEVIQRVLANDRNIAVSRIAREEAVLSLRGARGAYDPRLGFNFHDSRTVTPVSSSLGGATNGKLTTKDLLVDPQLSGATPWGGGTYKIDFSSQRTASDSTFNTLNPQFPTSLSFNYNQPLLRGLMYDDNRHRIQVARKNIEMSEAQFRQRVIETVTLSVQAYRELEFAVRNLEVQKEAVRLVREQEASIRRQVEQGLLAPVDIVQTQTQVATFEQNLFAAESALTNAENALKVLMLADRSDLMWGMSLTPDHTPDSPAAMPTLDEAVKAALASRPELKESELALDVNRLDAKLSKEQTKPQIDAYGTVGYTGLAGKVIPQTGANPFSAAFGPLVNQINQLSAQAGLPPLSPISFGGGSVPSAFIGGYGQSLNALGTGNYNTAVIGVTVGLPLRNRTATAAAAISAAEGRRLKTQKQQVEMAVEQDVRNALQAVVSATSRLRASVDARKSAEAQYASEERQFQAGTTTVFLVLQRQTELIAARTREARSEADFGDAQANLDRALARTIEVRNIAIK